MTIPRPPLATVAAIAAAPILLLSGFAWAAGWIGPPRIGGGTIASAIEANAGRHEGYRRAHAKGVCFTGYFEASGGAGALSRTPLLRSGRHAAIGRFSTGGGDPFATDGRNVFRAMALQLTGPDGEIWRLAMDHTPIFPVATPEAFVALQRASRPDPATGKPDPAAMKAYLARHPETRAYQDYIAAAPLPDSFANSIYYSINAFRFIDGAGASHAVRWAFEPEAAFGALDKAKLAELPTDHLFTDLGARLAKGPLRWRMTVTVAAPNWRDATKLAGETSLILTSLCDQKGSSPNYSGQGNPCCIAAAYSASRASSCTRICAKKGKSSGVTASFASGVTASALANRAV